MDKITHDIKRAGRIIRDGGLVAFPTETVYGLGGDALNAHSSRRIYEAKGRPSDNPLIIHIADMEALPLLVKEVPDSALLLAKHFWPGPLTMIFNASEKVPRQTTGGLSTVAVRMPGHETALAFIREAGGYVAAPSANTSGRPSPTLAAHVMEDLGDRIDLIIDGGPCTMGLESTIIDLTEDIPAILRPGFITREDIEGVLGMKVRAGSGQSMEDDDPGAPKAPGMKYRHYAPKGKMILVCGDTEDVCCYIMEETRKAADQGQKTGILCNDDTSSRYKDLPAMIISTGSAGDDREAGSKIYAALRNFDQKGIAVIYSEGFSEEGIGCAIMNRLRKAAGGNVIRV